MDSAKGLFWDSGSAVTVANPDCVLEPSPISPFSVLAVDIYNNDGTLWMDNGDSSSELVEHLSAHKPVLVQSPNGILVSPTLTAYSDPPPTYHHATETPVAASLSGESTEEENIPHLPTNSKKKKWPPNETTTSIISTTTTTTTTTSRTTSTSTTRPNIPSRVPSSSFNPTTSRRRSKSTESLMSTTSKSSDPYLDALLARSIAALELSNALLQSTLTTKSTLSSVLASDEALERRERAFEERLLRSTNPYYTPTTEFGGEGLLDSAGGRLAIEEREGKKMEWMREMESIVRDVELLFDMNPSDYQGTLQRPQRRASADPHNRRGQGEGGLVLGDHSSRTRSPPPRALTQYVSISGANAAGKGGFATEETADKDSIYLPSTTGLRRGPHKEPLSDVGKGSRRREGSTASAGSLSSAGGQNRGMGRGHSPIPSSSSNSGVGRYLTASNSVIHPATHPEALPLSPQELLELHSESTHAGIVTVMGSSGLDANDRHAYLRRFGAHSGTPSVSSEGGLGGSANSTLSRTRAIVTRPSLSPHQPAPRYERDNTSGKGKGKAISIPPTAAPSTTSFASFPSIAQQNLQSDSDIHHQFQSQSRSDHARTESTTTSHSATSISTTRSSRSSARSSLSLGNLSFSLPLPSSLSSALRRSPNLRGMGSPTSTNTDGSDVGEASYSPALEAIEDFEGEEGDTFGENDTRGRNWNSTIQSPTRGRAISRGRFRTADTLRRILDTSPSPRPTLSIPPRLTATSPRHISESQSIDRTSTRSNTDSSSKTITSRRTMRGSFASTESLALAIPEDYILGNTARMTGMHSASDIAVSSSIISSRSYTSAHSPSTVSSTSDLPSSDVDGGRRRPSDREGKRRLSLRPAPRFMPRTPGGRTAQLEVSGATARAPMMHAHLVELENPVLVRKDEGEERLAEEAAIGDLNPLPPMVEPLYYSSVSLSGTNDAHGSPTILSPPKPSTPAELPSVDPSQQERQRTQSLSASISSIINQARTLEQIKLASTGKVKGGSNLKGSPAWKAQHRLHGSVESDVGALGLPNSTSNASNDAAGGGPSSKRTSWIGSGLMGLGLAITPSSSTNVSTGAMTPPLRVSFAKEPIRYSEERESGTFEEEEEDEEDGSDAVIDVQGLDSQPDGGLTIKPRSIRRTKSWNGSVKGVGSRRVPSKKRSKGGESGKGKKEGWLEWFLTATTASGAGGIPGHMGASGSSIGIGREELFESRGRDDW